MRLQGDIRVIEYGTKWYEQEVALRYRVLRKPLGLEFTPEQLAAENTDIHIAYIVGEAVLGCLVLTPLDAKRIKMRQVAVDESVQGYGIGTAMVKFSEEYATNAGYDVIECAARKTAVPFYLRLKWQKVGGEFVEVTIPHYKMMKALVKAKM